LNKRIFKFKCNVLKAYVHTKRKYWNWSFPKIFHQQPSTTPESRCTFHFIFANQKHITWSQTKNRSLSILQTISTTICLTDFKRFWRWCTTPRITGFLDFVHRLVFYKLENTAFRKLDLFPSSCEEDTYSAGSFRKNQSQSLTVWRLALSKGPKWVCVFPPSHEDGNKSCFRSIMFCSFYSTGRWTKSGNPAIPSKCKMRQKLPLYEAMEVHKFVRCRGCHIFRQSRLMEARFSATLYPQEDSWYIFLLKVESIPGS
jgi:hypothetical protein